MSRTPVLLRLGLEADAIDPACITFRRRGLGGRASWPRTPVVLTVESDALRQSFAPYVDTLRAELQADDLLTGEFEPAYQGATEHPDIDALLSLPETARLQLINTFLIEDLLSLFFVEESPAPSCRWLMVNLLTGFDVRAEHVRITGELVPLSLSE